MSQARTNALIFFYVLSTLQCNHLNDPFPFPFLIFYSDMVCRIPIPAISITKSTIPPISNLSNKANLIFHLSKIGKITSIHFEHKYAHKNIWMLKNRRIISKFNRFINWFPRFVFSIPYYVYNRNWEGLKWLDTIRWRVP